MCQYKTRNYKRILFLKILLILGKVAKRKKTWQHKETFNHAAETATKTAYKNHTVHYESAER